MFIPTVLQAGTFSDPLSGPTTNIAAIDATGTMLTIVDGGAVPKVNVLSTTPISFSNLGGTVGQMMLSGYLVDCSAVAACASVVR